MNEKPKILIVEDDANIASGLNKVLVIVLSLFVYVVGLWLGAVLGLDGTLWD